MKILKTINTVILLITAILYLTIYYGLLSQILLGFIQIVTSLVIAYNFKKLDVRSKKSFKKYWLLVLTYALAITSIHVGGLEGTNNTLFWIIGLMVIPMSIAIYFYLILIKIKKQ